MREEHDRHGDDPVANGQGPTDRPSTSDEHQSNGFTAVNGDSYTNNSFRPDDSAKQYMTPYSGDDSTSRRPALATSNFHSHGWRPDSWPNREAPSQEPPDREESPSRKRKRSISVNVDKATGKEDTTSDPDDREASKRRAASTLDSAIDLTSPVTMMQTNPPSLDRRQNEPPLIGPYARERSPVARWNRGEPPPKPRPETEASLAESVNKFHQTQRSRETQHNSPPAENQTSSPTAEGVDQEANASDEDEPLGDNTDPKKPRKRNFSNRTKTGCHTCRSRKKKCDERKPICGNCERGHFTCMGYGPKPPPGMKGVPARHFNVQPKAFDGPIATNAYYQSPSDDAGGLSYSHWGRVPPAETPTGEHGRPYHDTGPREQHYPPPLRDPWPRPSWSGPHGTPSHFQERFPPPDYPHGPYYRDRAPPSTLPPPQQHVPPPISDPFAQYGPGELYHRPTNSITNRPPTVASSHSSSHSSQQAAAHLALTMAAYQQPSEKDKMLRGQPFLHWLDNLLIGERDSCAIAIDRYNSGSKSDNGLSREAKQGLFAQILDPTKRIHGGQRVPLSQQSPGPIGTVKDQTIVESPFKCDYGYNVHLGSSSVLQAGCYLQDAADITIGDRVIVGPDVKIHTLTAAVECAARKGSQGCVVAGAVSIEDDVFIGAGSVILPYCTVGKGAVVGAGSVVTRDVTENTVVAGNPAKFVRSINFDSGSSGGVALGEGRLDHRHAHEIQERNERVKQRMAEYANRGFTRYSASTKGPWPGRERADGQ